MQLALEKKKLKGALRNRCNADVLRLSPIQDKKKELCLFVLLNLHTPAYQIGNQELSQIIQIRQILLTFKYGHSRWTIDVLASAAEFAFKIEKDVNEGIRFIKLTEDMLEVYPEVPVPPFLAALKASVSLKRDYLDLSQQGYEQAMKVGNIFNAMTCLTIYSWSYFYSGLPLTPLLDDIERSCNQMLDYQQKFWFLTNIPLYQCLLNVTGRSKDPMDMESGEAIEKRKLVGPNPNGIGNQTVKSYSMQIAYYLGDINKATELYEELVNVKMPVRLNVIYHSRVFFFALICLANYRRDGKRKHKVNAKKHIGFLKELAQSGMVHLVHKVQILEATYASASTSYNGHDILRQYETALIAATKTGYLQDAALCAYLAGEHCSRCPTLGCAEEMYMMKAHELYMTWGAKGIARSIEQRHPYIFENSDLPIVRRSSSIRARPRLSASKATDIHKAVVWSAPKATTTHIQTRNLW